jgi:hypothetical protein
MATKLKNFIHLRIIQIGLNLFALVMVILSFQGCRLFNYDQSGTGYEIFIYNTTNDTLVITCNKGCFITAIELKESMLYPDSLISFYGVKVDEDENPLSAFKKERLGLDSCWIYFMDNNLRKIALMETDTVYETITPDRKLLRILWAAPFIESEDSVHSYFNLASWVVDDKNKTIEFSITESDYNVKK